MATVTLSSPEFYMGGTSGVSHVVGYGDAANRVVRYTFTTPSYGGSKFSFSFTNVTVYNGFNKVTPEESLRFYVGSDASSHANAGASSEYSGSAVVTAVDSGYTVTGEVETKLDANSTYYLWLFPSTTYWGLLWWDDAVPSAEVTGAQGVVYIDNGTSFDAYQVYIDNGTSWDLYIPYIDNGTEFVLYGGGD